MSMMLAWRRRVVFGLGLGFGLGLEDGAEGVDMVGGGGVVVDF